MPLWAILLLIAIVIVLFFVVRFQFRVETHLKKLDEWLTQELLVEFTALCVAVRDNKPPTCPSWSGKSPPTPPDYP